MISYTDFALMVSFIINCVTKFFALVGQYNLLQIPFMLFGAYLVLNVIRRLLSRPDVTNPLVGKVSKVSRKYADKVSSRIYE